MPGLVWKTKSLRFWLALGLGVAVLPLTASAVGGYLLLNRGVIASLEDISSRHRYQLTPTYRLSNILREAVEPVDEFVDDGDPIQPSAYRELRQRIEAGFADLHDHVQHDPEPRTLVERARDDWTAADQIATEAISVRRPGGDPHGAELMQRFHGLIAAAADKLDVVGTDLEQDLSQDHDVALLFYERSEWVTGIAAVVSLLAMIAAVVTIGRIVSSSVDRLVTGAEHFAAGDRDHRIDVQVPPELHRVAEEFNRMIVRIRESEAALSDLAHRDGLTKLLNRRAFDEALGQTFARVDRFGEPAALLLIDIDHFKRINDTHGHGVGDDVLRAVARTMGADVRLVDRVFRIGGEEFAVILSAADADGALTTAERLRESVAGVRVSTPGGEVAVTISVGVAHAVAGATAATLVNVADAALYRAKTEGRNRVTVSGGAHDLAKPQSGEGASDTIRRV